MCFGAKCSSAKISNEHNEFKTKNYIFTRLIFMLWNKALAAPSIDEMEKQPRVKQKNRAFFFKS